MGWSPRNQNLQFRKKILYKDLTRSEQEAWQNSSNVLVVWYCRLLACHMFSPYLLVGRCGLILCCSKILPPHLSANVLVQCRLPIVISHLPLSYVVCHVHADNVDNATHQLYEYPNSNALERVKEAGEDRCQWAPTPRYRRGMDEHRRRCILKVRVQNGTFEICKMEHSKSANWKGDGSPLH